MNTEQYETKIGDLEQKIESMENTNSIIYGVFLGLLTYFQFHNLLISIPLTLITIYIIQKFVADKPFTKNINTDNKE